MKTKTLTLEDLSKQELIDLIRQHYPVDQRDIRRVRHDTLFQKGKQLYEQGMALMRQYSGKQDAESLQGYLKGMDMTDRAQKLYDAASAVLAWRDPATQQELL